MNGHTPASSSPGRHRDAPRLQHAPPDASRTQVAITSDPLDIPKLLARALETRDDCGAIATFIGRVRHDGETSPSRALYIEHYPPMAQAALNAIAQNARTRWTLGQLILIHRVGLLPPRTPIVFVLATGRHRQDARRAVAFITDHTKTDAPFWKCEHYHDRQDWVGSRDTDVAAVRRWSRG